MNSKVKIFFVILILFNIALFSSSEGNQDHSFWEGFWKKALNSIILFGGLILLLRKRIIEFLSQKGLDIKNDIVHREESLKEKSIQLEEIGKRLKKIEEEVIEMRNIAKQKGEEENKKIREIGEKESKRILALTEAEIDNRVQSSIRKLKSRIADLTIERFKKNIKSELNKELHEKIIENNIKISGDIIDRK